MIISSVTGDAAPEVKAEILDLLQEHGQGAVNFIEEKYSVLLLQTGRFVEVYQLPEVEEL